MGLKFAMRKIIFLIIGLIAFLTASVQPASAFTLDSKYLEPTNSIFMQSQLADLLYPGLAWTEIKEKVSIDFLTKASSGTIRVQGTAYRSNGFEGKPSSELFAFYYLDHMKTLGWQYVGFINNSFLMEIQYYNPELNRGLDIKIGRCRFLDASNELGDQFCAEIWISSSAIVPAPKTRALTEVQIPSHSIIAEPDTALVNQNPLPVPFYSQRAADPNGKIFVGYGNCSFTLYDIGCTVAAYAMVYSYYQANFTNPIKLNETLKESPGVFSLYQSGCYIYWPDYENLPDAPAGVSGSPRVYNACTSPNCLDKSNITLIDSELKFGPPIHARVHWAGKDESFHSVVIIGHIGSDFLIRDPLALDSSPRTLSTGVEGPYIVDYLIPIHGSPPAEGVFSTNFLPLVDKVESLMQKSSRGLKRFLQ